jgi:hypothetical protein
MAAYKSLQMTAPRYPVSGPGIGGRSLKVERGEFALTAALALNDTIDMFKIHPRFRVCGGFVKVPDLDTGGSPAIVLALGDAGDDDRYFSGLTTGQAGGVATTMATTGVDYLNGGGFTTVQMKVTTAPATGATTGTIVAELWGYIEEPA